MMAEDPIDAIEDQNEYGIWIVRANGQSATTTVELAAKLGVSPDRVRLNINPELAKRTKRQQHQSRQATDVDAWLADF